MRACERCRRLFGRRRNDSAAQWAARRFCSRECYWAAMRAPAASKVCEQCGETFARPLERTDAVWAARRFCGRACSLTARRADEAGRFWSHVDRTDPTACWLWRGAVQDPEAGRGKFKVDGRFEYAYRLAYMLEVGPIADGMHVHHTCDVPSCVNPAHLETLTQKEHVELHAAERRGVKRPPEISARISRALRASPAVKALAESRRGVPRPLEVGAKVSATKKAKAAHG